MKDGTDYLRGDAVQYHIVRCEWPSPLPSRTRGCPGVGRSQPARTCDTCNCRECNGRSRSPNAPKGIRTPFERRRVSNVWSTILVIIPPNHMFCRLATKWLWSMPCAKCDDHLLNCWGCCSAMTILKLQFLYFIGTRHCHRPLSVSLTPPRH